MKLKDLHPENKSAVVTAPLKVDQPAEAWGRAVESKAIPQSLYHLYRMAGCLDATRPPRYLSAHQSVALFSFFKSVMESLRETLVELSESVVELGDLREREWREVREWMKDADEHPAIGQIRGFPKLHSDVVSKLEPRAFRSLLLTASGALDLSAELLSIFLPSPQLRLRTGRAEFKMVVDFLRGDPPIEPHILPVSVTLLSQLHARLRPLLGIEDGVEKDWYEFFMLYRNKVAHLGRHAHFTFGFDDPDNRIYMFLRKDWPFSLEEELLYPSGKKDLFENLIEVDVVEYSAGLAMKVRTLVGETATVVGEAFKIVRDSDPPEEVLRAFAANWKKYAFRYFMAEPETPAAQ